MSDTAIPVTPHNCAESSGGGDVQHACVALIRRRHAPWRPLIVAHDEHGGGGDGRSASVGRNLSPKPCLND